MEHPTSEVDAYRPEVSEEPPVAPPTSTVALPLQPIAAEVPKPSARRAADLSAFADVWREVSSDPYERLPRYSVTLTSFFQGFRYQLARSGARTIANQRDLLPRFRKLIRPNGICLAGTWNITEPSPYSGLFRTGARALLIARASVAFGETESGAYRAFGLAGKVFPTLDPQEPVRTGNFFVIDDNGGTRTEHFVDAPLTTHPGLSLNPSSLKNLPLLLAITIAQRLADVRSELRQLYPLSEVHVADRDLVRTPRFMKVVGRPEQRVRARDFRDQLRAAHFQGPLAFDVAVRDSEKAPWQTLGALKFDRDVVSDSGDHRLHFSHPRWRADSRH
jgi:hypothetical protein